MLLTKKKPAKQPAKLNTTAVHATGKDGTQFVGIGNLRVLIIQEEGYWFAQGLEIDYAAQGNSLRDVKKQFEDGLMGLIHENLKIYGNIDRLLKVAPEGAWNEFFANAKALKKRYSQFSIHPDFRQASLPFGGIDYLERAQAA